ncbi:hypothetical protein [Cryptosporidium hominis TU502]|uniref:hypothetical protein n=1 Tax=Cryptosporidium hominis (strain TU502) TaxID=353151 RepID=UPI0000453487|nr:hypothetical protein [Cryptosporidium hominis TU502]
MIGSKATGLQTKHVDLEYILMPMETGTKDIGKMTEGMAREYFIVQRIITFMRANGQMEGRMAREFLDLQWATQFKEYGKMEFFHNSTAYSSHQSHNGQTQTFD